MQIKSLDIIIDENSSFDTDDKLGRKHLAESLTKTISAVEDVGFVFALNSQWEMENHVYKLWQNYAKKNDKKSNKPYIKSIYFDAFENDYSDEPFIDIVSAIDLFLKKEGFKDRSKTDLTNKALSVSEKYFLWPGV